MDDLYIFINSYKICLNGLIEQQYLSGSLNTRDYRGTWNYPITINTLVYANPTGFSNVASSLLQYNIVSVDLGNNTIEGHFFGYNASTPVTRCGFIIKGY